MQKPHPDLLKRLFAAVCYSTQPLAVAAGLEILAQ